MLKISVIIPALNPDNRLNKLIQDLNETKGTTRIVNNIIVIDDGSDKIHQSIFQQLESLPIKNLKVLHHEYNKGKGAALKTGFKYIENNGSKSNHVGKTFY